MISLPVNTCKRCNVLLRNPATGFLSRVVSVVEEGVANKVYWVTTFGGSWENIGMSSVVMFYIQLSLGFMRAVNWKR